MEVIRKMVKDLVDVIPEEKLKKVFEAIEGVIEERSDQAWSTWDDIGRDAAEGKWENASERHDFYLYGINPR